MMIETELFFWCFQIKKSKKYSHAALWGIRSRGSSCCEPFVSHGLNDFPLEKWHVRSGYLAGKNFQQRNVGGIQHINETHKQKSKIFHG